MDEDGKVSISGFYKCRAYLYKLHKTHKEVLHQSEENPSEVKLMALFEGDSPVFKHHHMKKSSIIHQPTKE